MAVNPAIADLNAAVANPRADIAALDALERKLFAIRYAIDEIGSLGPVIDPPSATEERGEACSILEEERIHALCAPEVGPLLERLGAQPELLGETKIAQVNVLKRDRASLVDVPAEEQAAFSRLTVEANDVWLDEYEHGTNRAFYDPFFAQVKDCVVPLLADCMASRHKPSHQCVDGSFDEARQWALADDLMKLEGVDPNALWLGRTEHPFTGGPSVGFVLIASHVYPDNVLSNVFSMLHEGGHALYEQNVDPAYRLTSLKGGTSMGMHEAQSRFFENIIGRSEAFATPLLQTLRGRFPGQFGRVTPHQLYLAENCAEPCLIRCDADELTYPLHILVRYEIEQLLFSGEAKASDVPRLWAEKYKGYLGIDVPDDARGALQDTHWSDGSLGYFPTYALGSAIGAQLKDAMVTGGMDFEGVCASGDLAPVREWLRSNIWRWGRSKDTDELVRAACDGPFDAKHYTDYLTQKFSAIYEL